ncbi:hypothetical protein EJ07DRAFT_160111 [Lizonia empirigonia]|nr:hypothetical protein EJ07DRAFT_160111 [Lizonia empirigonia]
MPHAYMMQLAKYLGSCVCAWGTVVACTAACDSHASLAVCRFLLSMFESAISPASSSAQPCGTSATNSPSASGSGTRAAVMVGSLISHGFQAASSTTGKSRTSSWA